MGIGSGIGATKGTDSKALIRKSEFWKLSRLITTTATEKVSGSTPTTSSPNWIRPASGILTEKLAQFTSTRQPTSLRAKR